MFLLTRFETDQAEESRGFGFVKMDTPEDASAVLDQLNGTDLEGKIMTVAFAKRGRARTPTPGQYHGYKLDDRPPYGGGRGGYGGGGGYRGGGGGGYGQSPLLLVSKYKLTLADRPYQPRSYDSRYSDRGPPRCTSQFMLTSARLHTDQQSTTDDTMTVGTRGLGTMTDETRGPGTTTGETRGPGTTTDEMTDEVVESEFASNARSHQAATDS
jgi:hypothetical protein